MFSRLQTILKQQVHPYALLAASLTIAALVTALSGLWHHSYELSHRAKPSGPSTVTVQSASAAANNLGVRSQPAAASAAPHAFSSSDRSSNNTRAQANSSQAVAGVSANPQTAAPAPQAAVEVSLSINGIHKGIVSLPSGSNQCDVLSQALAGGLISSLVMKYWPSYKGNAVHIIDGIGDSNVIGWVYEVRDSNGKFRSVSGCSNTQALNGDVINWKH